MFSDKHFIKFIQNAKEDKKDIVLISVLDTQGTTYRKGGAMMLVNSDGNFIGVISGGCFEEDIVACAKDILSKREGKFVEHDLRLEDDSLESWNNGIGCNGLIRIWMEPFFYDEDYGILSKALNSALSKENKVLVRSIDAKNSKIIEKKLEQRSFYDEKEKLFYQRIDSPFKLLILGAGVGSEPILEISNTLAWQTLVCDLRQSNISYMKSADETRILKNIDDIKELDLDSFDAALVMSHDFKSDAFYMNTLVDSNIEYIGLMGPKHRAKKILEGISSVKEYENRLFNPVGLDLGGESPESIALSICAEIEARRFNKKPIHLKDKVKSIHE